MFKYTFGLDGHFEIDVTYSTYGLDQKALLKLKEKPGKLNGRVYKVALSDSCGRKIDAWHERIRTKLGIQNNLVTYDDIVDDEPDVIGEHLAEKAIRRKHRDVTRFYQVRRPDYNASLKLKSRRKAANRCSRQNLNKMAIIAEKDFVGKHGSFFADEGGWSVRGSRNLDVRR